MIDNTLKGKTVVRLKGGDPFIFGRGGEEAIALVNKEVDVEIIPGVSSVSAAPSYAGIPLTHRDHNSSFLVATGHEDPKKSKSNLPWRYMSEVGTLVFLMGLGNIKKEYEKTDGKREIAFYACCGNQPRHICKSKNDYRNN